LQSGDLVIGSSGDCLSDHPITRDDPIYRSYFAPVLPTFFFNLSPT
jgi:hypothetical protein